MVLTAFGTGEDMGRLRTEPKARRLLSDDEYSSFLEILERARHISRDHHIYWDLEDNENPNRIRKAFMHIAEREGIPVFVRRERETNSLSIRFRETSRPTTSRMSAAECQKRIMNALQKAKRPLQKGEIIRATGISPSTWNIRSKELMLEGKVIRQGERRDTRYHLPGS